MFMCLYCPLFYVCSPPPPLQPHCASDGFHCKCELGVEIGAIWFFPQSTIRAFYFQSIFRKSSARVVITILMCAVFHAQAFNCSTCGGNATDSICCACCVGGVLQAGLCNAPQYAGCLPPPTPSITASNTPSSSWTPSITFSPVPTPILSLSDYNTLFFTASSEYAYWEVPVGVFNISVRVWGGGGANNAVFGGSGAYAECVTYVTPGETLRINIGCVPTSYLTGPVTGVPLDICGDPGFGTNHGVAGGGFSSVARLPVVTMEWEFIILAGAGGGGSSVYDGHEGQGLEIDPNGCGMLSPFGATNGNIFGGGGGGGWIGGSIGSNNAYGKGGTSCAPGCIFETVLSLNGSHGFAAYENSPYHVAGSGGPNEPGLVVLSWDGPNPSPSNTASATASPTLSPSAPASSSATVTHTAGATPSLTVTASVSPYCNPSVFQSFPSSDLVGSLVGTVSMQPSAYSCQLACCSVPGCDGYTFASMQLVIGAVTGPCYLLANVTQLVPNHFATSGVRASVFSA